MDKDLIISKTAKYVEDKLSGEGTGHDWWHIHRVWKTAKHIAEIEQADLFVVQLATLLHDIADWKFNNGDENIGGTVASEWLQSLNVDKETINHVREIINTSSFKGAGVQNKIRTLEGKIVQDADRLDALGAIGIARAFAYGGNKGRELYNPNIQPVLHTTAEHYKSSVGSTINHFYEKLLLLKDLMHTDTAKKMAQSRHVFMEQFVTRFLKEWEGEL